MTTADTTRYLSKAELRKEVALLQKQLENAKTDAEYQRNQRDRLARALDHTRLEHSASYAALKSLGFEPILDLVPIEANGPRQLTGWRRPKGFVASTEEELNEVRESYGRAIRYETLTTVIAALGLKEYDNRGKYPKILPQQPPALDTDRLWSDLQTALDVRAERKAQADREATEKRVSALAEHPTAGQIAGALADRLEDIVGVTIFPRPLADNPHMNGACDCKPVATTAEDEERLAKIKKPKKEKAA